MPPLASAQQDSPAVSQQQLPAAEDIATLVQWFLSRPEQIGQFGRDWVPDIRPNEVDSSQPVAQLSQTLEQILSRLTAAHPYTFYRRHNWLARCLGQHLVSQAAHLEASSTLASLLSEVDAQAQEVRALYQRLETEQAEILAYRDRLSYFIAETRKWLQGRTPSEPVLETETCRYGGLSPEDRLLRRLASLETLVATWDLQAEQTRLAEAHLLLTLDRYHAVKEVLLPLWRQLAQQVSPSKLTPQAEAAMAPHFKHFQTLLASVRAQSA